MSSSGRILVALGAAFLSCSLPILTAQEAAGPVTPTLSVKVRVVAVAAVVRGRDGKQMDNLTRLDFELREDGRTVPIRYFSHDDNLPIQIALLVDTSGSERGYFREIAAASGTFLRAMLVRPEDRATVLRFDSDVRLLAKQTGNLRDLEHSLTRLGEQHVAANPHAGTLLYDAVCAATRSALPSGQGRRAFVLITDGEDNGSADDLDTAIRCAQANDVSVYAVLYTDKPWTPSLLDNPLSPVPQNLRKLPGTTAMARMTNATGGHAFLVSRETPVDQVFKQIEDEMRTQYRLGYTPVQAKPGSYHQLDLRVKPKGARVQSRIGYYTPPKGN